MLQPDTATPEELPITAQIHSGGRYKGKRGHMSTTPTHSKMACLIDFSNPNLYFFSLAHSTTHIRTLTHPPTHPSTHSLTQSLSLSRSLVLFMHVSCPFPLSSSIPPPAPPRTHSHTSIHTYILPCCYKTHTHDHTTHGLRASRPSTQHRTTRGEQHKQQQQQQQQQQGGREGGSARKGGRERGKEGGKGGRETENGRECREGGRK